MLDADSRATEGLDNVDGDDVDLLEQMADLSLNQEAKKTEGDEEIKKRVLNISNPIFQVLKINYRFLIVEEAIKRLVLFQEKRASSKIEKVMEELTKLKASNEQSGVMEKAVIVSQWTSMLDIVKKHVQGLGMRCVAINGMTTMIA